MNILGSAPHGQLHVYAGACGVHTLHVYTCTWCTHVCTHTSLSSCASHTGSKVPPGELSQQVPGYVLSTSVHTVMRQVSCGCYGCPPLSSPFLPGASPATPLLGCAAHPLGWSLGSIMSTGTGIWNPRSAWSKQPPA